MRTEYMVPRLPPSDDLVQRAEIEDGGLCLRARTRSIRSS